MFLILFPAYVLFAGLLFIQFKRDQSARYWALGCLSEAAGLLCSYVEPNAQLFFFSSLLTLYGWMLFFIALEVFLFNKSKLLPWALPVCFVHVLFVDSLLSLNLVAYVGFYIGTALAGLNFYFYSVIAKGNRQSKNTYVDFIAMTYLLLSLVWISRIFLFQITGLSLVLDSGLANATLIIMQQLSYFAIRHSVSGQQARTQCD